jgi:UDP-N-acetylglucosamine--N-acetylmuramyl-(pentapeptide) pyrophosphoryl-undecaprenol N-acetylglucosamine transferase
MEERIVANESTLPFRALPAAPLRGRGPIAALRGLGVTLAGVWAALALIRKLRPAAILGTGGYVCVPLFLAARIARVPTVIYLPDVVPGLAVRFLARIANRTAVNVDDALPNLFGRRRANAVVTGYPVRAELFQLDRAACRAAFDVPPELPVIFVYGGSRGARSINQAIAVLLPHLLRHAAIIHVCGREGDAAWLRESAAQLSAELQERYKLYEYLASAGHGGRGTGEQGAASTPLSPGHPVRVSMTAAFGAADLAVCRSGASTLAELPAAGLPAVLVPYPYVHQDENADYLVRRGAAVKVADAQMLDAGRPQEGALYQAILRLLHNEHERQHMAERSRALVRPDAARHLAQVLLGLTARSTHAI